MPIEAEAGLFLGVDADGRGAARLGAGAIESLSTSTWP